MPRPLFRLFFRGHLGSYSPHPTLLLQTGHKSCFFCRKKVIRQKCSNFQGTKNIWRRGRLAIILPYKAPETKKAEFVHFHQRWRCQNRNKIALDWRVVFVFNFFFWLRILFSPSNPFRMNPSASFLLFFDEGPFFSEVTKGSSNNLERHGRRKRRKE